MPPITIKPMVDVVLSLGLRPVFVDLELETLCFDVDQLKKAITPKTRAILVSSTKLVPDLEPLLTVSQEHGLVVIEDFSHALNASFRGKKLGTFGHGTSDTDQHTHTHTHTSGPTPSEEWPAPIKSDGGSPRRKRMAGLARRWTVATTQHRARDAVEVAVCAPSLTSTGSSRSSCETLSGSGRPWRAVVSIRARRFLSSFGISCERTRSARTPSASTQCDVHPVCTAR